MNRSTAFQLQLSWSENERYGDRLVAHQYASGIVVVRDIGVQGALGKASQMVNTLTVKRRETAFDVECVVTRVTESTGFAGDRIGEAVKEPVAIVRSPKGPDDDGVEMAPTDEEIEKAKAAQAAREEAA